MKHFLYLLVCVLIFSSCESDLAEIAPATTDQVIASQDFAEIARANIQDPTRQEVYLNQQNQILSLSENERSKALGTVSNASELGSDLYKSYNNLGNEFYRNGNYNLALFLYLTSVELKIQEADSESLALTYRNIGLAYEALEDYENAAINLWQSYYLYETLGNTSKSATLLNDLGAVYDLAHDFVSSDLFDVENSLALGYYTQSVELNETLGDFEGVAQAQSNIGLLFETYSRNGNTINSRNRLEPSRDQDDVEDEL